MPDHPAYMALLTRCAHGPAVPVEERDRILRACFPELPYEATLRVLKEAYDLHRAGMTYEARTVIESLVDENQDLRRKPK